MSVKENIAFIGAGSMGRPMIRHLLLAGYCVTVFVRRAEVRADIKALGALIADSPAKAAKQADFVLTNVTSTSDVEEVLFGHDGVVTANLKGAVCIDFSTISPFAAPEIARRLATHGLHFLDAPVSGGVKGAEAGTLSIMVGGDEAVLGKVMPVLACLGKTITHIGPNGAGQVAKACNQLVQVINIQGIAEAMQFARCMHADPWRVLEAISVGMAGSKMLDLMGPKMASRDFAAGIEARLHAKDFGLIVDAVDKLQIPMPATQTVYRQLQRLMENGWGGDDTSSLLRVIESQASERNAKTGVSP